jgi:hypothetical protein
VEPLFEWAFLCGLVVSLIAYFYKDGMPDPSFYDAFSLDDPTKKALKMQQSKGAMERVSQCQPTPAYCTYAAQSLKNSDTNSVIII